jgi:hypothetical protein
MDSTSGLNDAKETWEPPRELGGLEADDAVILWVVIIEPPEAHKSAPNDTAAAQVACHVAR